MTERKLPAPKPTVDAAPFWAAAREGRFVLPRCGACNRVHWYPRAVCPFCAADVTEWVEASGTGVVYAYSVMRRSDPPYVIAYVELAEGPRMLTNIVSGDVDAVRIGSAVALRWTETNGGPPVPNFTLAA